MITGASDGIGAAAACHLHERGHTVAIIGRSREKTTNLASELGVDHFIADFTSLDGVRRLAGDLHATYPKIDVLANNAGGVFGDPATTVDGHEKTFQINHLAPFLLTTLLIDRLIESQATVIQTTTVRGGLVQALDLDDLNSEHGLDPVRAYNAAKLENVLFTKDLHRRYHARGLSAAVFNPGIVRTNFGSETTSPLMKFLSSNRFAQAMLGTPPERGLINSSGWPRAPPDATGSPGSSMSSASRARDSTSWPTTQNSPAACGRSPRNTLPESGGCQNPCARKRR